MGYRIDIVHNGPQNANSVKVFDLPIISIENQLGQKFEKKIWDLTNDRQEAELIAMFGNFNYGFCSSVLFFSFENPDGSRTVRFTENTCSSPFGTFVTGPDNKTYRLFEPLNTNVFNKIKREIENDLAEFLRNNPDSGRDDFLNQTTGSNLDPILIGAGVGLIALFLLNQ